MDPRLIRANIALFQGKRNETRRLLEDYAVDQENPEVAQREPMILWLDAHARPKHTERVSGLTTVVDQVPADSPYHQMAKSYLQEEEHYTQLLDVEKQRKPGVRRWQVVSALVAVAVVIGAFIVFGQLNAPPPIVEATEQVTEEPTVLPTSTPIVQNTPAPATLADGSLPTTGFEILGYNGAMTVRGIDQDVRFVVDTNGNEVKPADAGAKFYGLLVEFQCLIPLCNDAPEAELYVQLNTGNFRVLASEGVSIAGEPALSRRVSQGQTTRGWVIFEIPRSNPPTDLVIWPPAPQGSDTRPDPVVVGLPG
ncbi:MAG: hypothetical protein K8J31_11565 [Anaerolineae bacterium]|nr:hypothetical protein [Anaerolineae bacterium]